MLRNGTFSYWYGVLYMIVVRINPSTNIITLFLYDTVWYGTGTGTVPIPYGTVINYGMVRYLYGTFTVKLTIQLIV
jgi:hypothetical protein